MLKFCHLFYASTNSGNNTMEKPMENIFLSYPRGALDEINSLSDLSLKQGGSSGAMYASFDA